MTSVRTLRTGEMLYLLGHGGIGKFMGGGLDGG
jgi:hypothetical protein